MKKLPKIYFDDKKTHISLGDDPRPILKKYGFCVIKNVFSKKECQDTIDSMWKWLEGLGTGIKRKDKKTWSNKFWPVNLHQGLIHHTMGHEEFIWRIREHKNIKDTFKKIFSTDKLLVSFDGMTIARPRELGYVDLSSDESWLHTDQNIIEDVKVEDVYESEFYSIQGIANFENVGDKDASLLIGESSHLLHSKLFKNNGNKPKGNWYILSKNDIDWCKDVKFIKVNPPQGSLMLFDSRCFHQAYANKGKRKEERFRYVIYVAMTPVKRATKKDIKKKLKAIKKGYVTSHWSSNNIKLFSIPRVKDKECPYLKRKENIPDYKKWSDERKKLAGLIKY